MGEKEKKKMKDLEKMKRIFLKLLILLLIAKKADCNFFKNVQNVKNVTVSEGAEAIFSCKMNEEQEESGKTVGWVKHDTKSILAIGNHVITHDLRISVSNNGRRIWNLHINNVKKADEGQYFCQINTDPMQNFMRNLQVVGNKVDPDELEPEFIATSSTTFTTSTTTILLLLLQLQNLLMNLQTRNQ